MEILKTIKECFDLNKQIKETEKLAIKFADGELSLEEWEPVKASRIELKARLAELQAQIGG